MRLVTDRQLQEWEREAQERTAKIQDLEERLLREYHNVGILSRKLDEAGPRLASLTDEVDALRDAGRRVAEELGEDEVAEIRLLASALDLLIPAEQEAMVANMGALAGGSLGVRFEAPPADPLADLRAGAHRLGRR